MNMVAMMKEIKTGINEKEWRPLDLLYTNDLVLYGELEEDLKAMVEWFAEVCRRRGLKVNAGKSKMMVIGGEEGLQCKVFVDVIRAEHVSEFKYLRCVLDEPGTDEAE